MQFIKKLAQKLISDKRGVLSLTELLATASIVSTVAAMGTTQMDTVIPTARDAQRHGNIHQIETALALYYDDTGAYPRADNANDEATVTGWSAMESALEGAAPYPYMPDVPADPLNTNEYRFKYWSDGQHFKITYVTEDPDDDAVITRWGL